MGTTWPLLVIVFRVCNIWRAAVIGHSGLKKIQKLFRFEEGNVIDT